MRDKLIDDSIGKLSKSISEIRQIKESLSSNKLTTRKKKQAGVIIAIFTILLALIFIMLIFIVLSHS